MRDAVDILLSMQNSDGGFASYELIRATQYMELINPAEVFGESCPLSLADDRTWPLTRSETQEIS